ncbi:hypothetical protein CRM22_005934 [Opisthorchis felineus]|uniref:Uncharacterized protein n=1 Tax=Opisthorchis felineus TaxID=147828 RepID=A0A4S2LVZ9_OPIFE|nr:hypothetical protein CRM22_005934 [Opisthorchis felineus]
MNEPPTVKRRSSDPKRQPIKRIQTKTTLVLWLIKANEDGHYTILSIIPIKLQPTYGMTLRGAIVTAVLATCLIMMFATNVMANQGRGERGERRERGGRCVVPLRCMNTDSAYCSTMRRLCGRN